MLFSQIDFVNPYQQRSDLWIQRGGHEHRLTFGQRLTSPDARADGEIVAAQIIPGARVSSAFRATARRITPLTTGSYDEQWTEPRWSHAGDRIVASRWLRGNISQIVVIDTLGRIVHVVSSGTSIEATPSWLPDDAGVLYSSDRDRHHAGLRRAIRRHAHVRRRVDASVERRRTTGLFEPCPRRAPMRRRRSTSGPTATTSASARLRCQRPASAVPDYRDTLSHAVSRRSSPTRAQAPYSPWRTLFRAIGCRRSTTASTAAIASARPRAGFDVDRPPRDRRRHSGSRRTTPASLGSHIPVLRTRLPVLQVDASQDWDSLGGIFARTPTRPLIGELFRRTRTADALATWLRQRVRTALSVTGGVALESRYALDYRAGADRRARHHGRFGRSSFPTSSAQASRTISARRSAFRRRTACSSTSRSAIGCAADHGGQAAQSLSTVGIAAALYKSLDLPGFAHHVLALRGAAGYADDRANGYFCRRRRERQHLPDHSRLRRSARVDKTFPVRGFPRARCSARARSPDRPSIVCRCFCSAAVAGILPFFFDRTLAHAVRRLRHRVVPDVAAGARCAITLGQDHRRIDIGSVGAELNLNLGVLSWDRRTASGSGSSHPTLERSCLRSEVRAGVFVVGAVISVLSVGTAGLPDRTDAPHAAVMLSGHVGSMPVSASCRQRSSCSPPATSCPPSSDRRLRPDTHQAPAGFLRHGLRRQRGPGAPPRRAEERRRHRRRARPATRGRRRRSCCATPTTTATPMSTQRFGEGGVHGVVLAGDSDALRLDRERRPPLSPRRFARPKKRVDTIVTGLAQRQIPSHTLAHRRARQPHRQHRRARRTGAPRRKRRAPGRDPCPELETSGGIWSFRTDQRSTASSDGTRIATGLHNAVALAVNPGDTMVYAVSHGRDGLHDLWPACTATRRTRRSPLKR